MTQQLKYRWLAVAFHALVFVATFGTVYLRSQPLFDGPAGYAVNFLLVADFPFSLAGLGAMWGGMWVLGLVLWGLGGSVLWFFWARIIQHFQEAHRTGRRVKV